MAGDRDQSDNVIGRMHVVGAVGNYATVTQNFSSRPAEPSWPMRIGRPPLEADCYVRRPIEEELGSETRARRSNVVIISGDGGLGKSQVARRLWRTWTTTNPRDLILWVDASSREQISAALSQAAVLIGVSSTGDGAGDAAFLNWLSITDKTWAIVFDDLVDPLLLAQALPAEHLTNGVVVVTTRLSTGTIFRSDRTHVPLEVFSVDTARNYMQLRLHRGESSPRGSLERLVNKLQCLPLALAQASAFIINTGLTPQGYIELFDDRRNLLARLLPPDPGDGHLYAVATTWALSLERLASHSPNSDFDALASILARMSPQGVPNSILQSEPVRSFVTTLSGRTDNLTRFDVQHMVARMHQFSVVELDSVDGVAVVRMHALAQRAQQEMSGGDQALEMAIVGAIADGLVAGWPSDPGTLGTLFRSNAAMIMQRQHAPMLCSNDGPHDAVWHVGWSLEQAGLAGVAHAHWTQFVDAMT